MNLIFFQFGLDMISLPVVKTRHFKLEKYQKEIKCRFTRQIVLCLDQPSKFLTHSACLICRSFVGLLTRYNTSNVRRYVQKSRPMGEQQHRKMTCVCRLTPRIYQLQYRSVSELQNTSLIARILKTRFTHLLHPDSKFPKFWPLFREQNFSNILPTLTSFKSSGLFYYTALIWPNEYGPGLPCWRIQFNSPLERQLFFHCYLSPCKNQ